MAGHPPRGPPPGCADLATPRPRAAGTLSCQLSPRSVQGLPGHPWAAVCGSGSEQTNPKCHMATTGQTRQEHRDHLATTHKAQAPMHAHTCAHTRTCVCVCTPCTRSPGPQRHSRQLALPPGGPGPVGCSRWWEHVLSGLRPCQACPGARTLQSVGWHMARPAGAAPRTQLFPHPTPISSCLIDPMSEESQENIYEE